MYIQSRFYIIEHNSLFSGAVQVDATVASITSIVATQSVTANFDQGSSSSLGIILAVVINCLVTLGLVTLIAMIVVFAFLRWNRKIQTAANHTSGIVQY